MLFLQKYEEKLSHFHVFITVIWLQKKWIFQIRKFSSELHFQNSSNLKGKLKRIKCQCHTLTKCIKWKIFISIPWKWQNLQFAFMKIYSSLNGKNFLLTFCSPSFFWIKMKNLFYFWSRIKLFSDFFMFPKLKKKTQFILKLRVTERRMKGVETLHANADKN